MPGSGSLQPCKGCPPTQPSCTQACCCYQTSTVSAHFGEMSIWDAARASSGSRPQGQGASSSLCLLHILLSMLGASNSKHFGYQADGETSPRWVIFVFCFIYYMPNFILLYFSPTTVRKHPGTRTKPRACSRSRSLRAARGGRRLPWKWRKQLQSTESLPSRIFQKVQAVGTHKGWTQEKWQLFYSSLQAEHPDAPAPGEEMLCGAPALGNKPRRLLSHWFPAAWCPACGGEGKIFLLIFASQKLSDLSQMSRLWVVPFLSEQGKGRAEVLGCPAARPGTVSSPRLSS